MNRRVSRICTDTHAHTRLLPLCTLIVPIESIYCEDAQAHCLCVSIWDRILENAHTGHLFTTKGAHIFISRHKNKTIKCLKFTIFLIRSHSHRTIISAFFFFLLLLCDYFFCVSSSSSYYFISARLSMMVVAAAAVATADGDDWVFCGYSERMYWFVFLFFCKFLFHTFRMHCRRCLVKDRPEFWIE